MKKQAPVRTVTPGSLKAAISMPMEAKELLSPFHPLHTFFTKWVEKRASEHGDNILNKALTVRKARKFLAKFPQFRQAKAA